MNLIKRIIFYTAATIFVLAIFSPIKNVSAAESGCCCNGDLETGLYCAVVPLQAYGASGDPLCPGGERPVYEGGSKDIQTQCENYAYESRTSRGTYCFCSTNVEKITLENRTGYKSDCIMVEVGSDDCSIKEQKGYDDCKKTDSETCASEKSNWDKRVTARLEELGIKGQTAISSKFIPECALLDSLSPECRDVSIFVVMLINIGKYVFQLVGALVVLMLIIGGFQLIISQGNPEKIKKGVTIMLGALVGLAVVFGAYMLVRFLGNTVGLDPNLRLPG